MRSRRNISSELAKLYDKRNVITFPIVNTRFTSSNIPASPSYGVCNSQLILYSRACPQYSDFLDRAQLMTQKLPKQDYVMVIATTNIRSSSQ